MKDHTATPTASDITPAREDQPRRNFIVRFAAVVIGAVVALTPLVLGTVTFLDPLARKKKTPKFYEEENAAGALEGFVRVASLSSLTTAADPLRFPVIADQHDVWNFTPDQPIGAVYLDRTGASSIRCFNATCPHAGCSVAYSVATQTYDCPCHNSSFARDGKKMQSNSGRENPSPRDLDPLDVHVVDDNVYVKFQNFYTGKRERKPKA